MPDALTNILSGIRIVDFFDIAIVAFVVYKLLMFIQDTRAEQLLKGLFVLLVAMKISEWQDLYTLHWILINTMQLGMIAMIIVFQPELRRALQYLGRGKLINKTFSEFDRESAEHITSSIMNAIRYFARNKIGSIIILERDTGLNDVVETGTMMNSDISKELLINIFNTGAPLHDGAVIIRGSQIIAAGCVLPLTSSNNISSDLGTRHRAGIGITENSDAIALIVSEETGAMSVAMNGNLSRFMDANAVEKVIMSVYLNASENRRNLIKPFIQKMRRRKDEQE